MLMILRNLTDPEHRLEAQTMTEPARPLDEAYPRHGPQQPCSAVRGTPDVIGPCWNFAPGRTFTCVGLMSKFDPKQNYQPCYLLL